MHPLLDDVRHAKGSRASVAAVHEALVTSCGPLLRPIGDGTTEVTFVWLDGDDDPKGAVSLQCALAERSGRSRPMERVADGVWALTAIAPDGLLVAYRFVIDDPFRAVDEIDDARWLELTLEAQHRSLADPHNPRRIAPIAALFGVPMTDAQHESILALPEAPLSRWFALKGREATVLDRFTFTSTSVPSTRTISVLTPAGAATDEQLPLVVLLDGSSWVSLAGLPAALDAATADGVLPPAVVAFVHEAEGSNGLLERIHELSCNPAHARMIVHELLPLLRDRYPVDAAPGRTVLGGASLGGLASVYTALEHDTIGNVLSVSGSLWYGTERDGLPEWLTRCLAVEPRRDLRIYQQIGRLEDQTLALSPGVSHLVANRHFRDVAIAKGYELHYDELDTAHDICAFREAIVRGLTALLGGRVR